MHQITTEPFLEQIADEMDRWFQARAADGFLVQPPMLPGELDDFCRMVIPVLQERGLFQAEYEGTTLRHNLWLMRPAGCHAR